MTKTLTILMTRTLGEGHWVSRSLRVKKISEGDANTDVARGDELSETEEFLLETNLT